MHGKEAGEVPYLVGPPTVGVIGNDSSTHLLNIFRLSDFKKQGLRLLVMVGLVPWGVRGVSFSTIKTVHLDKRR